MKRVSDLSVVCVAAVLALAMLFGPPARQPGTPAVPGPSVPASSPGAEDTDEAKSAARTGDHRDDRRGHEVLDMAREPWSRRLEGPRPGREVPARLTPELIDACLAVAQDIDLQLAAELHKLREEDPQQFERRLRHSRRLIALAELRQRDPSLYELKKLELKVDAEVIHLAREARRARREGRTSDAEALEKQLHGQVILQLGFAIRNREDYVCRLQELAAQMEEELARQRQPENFNQAVEQRMKELLSDPGVDRRGREGGGSWDESGADRPPPP